MLTKIGALKIAAKKTGVSFEEYQANLEAGLKWCSTGRHFAPIGGFAHNKLKYDGREPECRACSHVDVRVNRKGRPSVFEGKTHTEEAKRKMSESHMGERNHRWKGGYSAGKPLTDGMLARRAVNHAVASSKLPRIGTQLCRCGKVATRYHHINGYSREHWLDVAPLCASCNAITLHTTGCFRAGIRWPCLRMPTLEFYQYR